MTDRRAHASTGHRSIDVLTARDWRRPSGVARERISEGEFPRRSAYRTTGLPCAPFLDVVRPSATLSVIVTALRVGR